ncbi:MAG: TlpA family protein disulfide reductase [Wenzhouxiangella sp.]
MRKLGLVAVVALLGFVLGAGLAWLTRESPSPAAGTEGAAVGDPQPGFRHRSLDGGTIEAAGFEGRPFLVNFWATWCAPCRREMPVLQEAGERHAGSLEIIGIALDDPEPVAEFVADLGIDYRIATGSDDVMRTQRAWGNSAGALPYTVLVDDEGTIVWQHYGEVTPEELDRELAEVLP